MSWSTVTTNETLKKIGGVWVNINQIAAMEIGTSGINVHLKSGARVTLGLERTQAELDRAAIELFSSGKEKNDE